jgi:manganese oxidase
MKLSRRNLILAAGTTALAATQAPRAAEPVKSARGYVPVRTLNGWTLPYRMRDGAKEFHLVAEELEHEFAPGCKAKVWGYNGCTPGPTIEAVEGDRVRLLVTNRLGERTTIHWHGMILPAGMDGIGGLTQPHIMPGETYVYEFTLRQSGTHMYHPHADEMTQMALGMMGLFIIHPRGGDALPVDRDFALLLHNWALHPGTYRPDPSILQDFDLWTFNSKVFPAIEPLVARSGDRVRIRADPRRQSLDVEPPDSSARRGIRRHGLGRGPLAAKPMAARSHRSRGRRTDA